MLRSNDAALLQEVGIRILENYFGGVPEGRYTNLYR